MRAESVNSSFLFGCCRLIDQPKFHCIPQTGCSL